MLIDYLVRDDSPPDEPVWTKSLVSSMDRRHGDVSVLPLSVSVQEVLDWVNLASDEGAWSSRENRQSLLADISQSAEALGPGTAARLKAPIAALRKALTRLDQAAKPVLRESIGSRASPDWSAVRSAASALLSELGADAAVKACWRDLVGCSQNPRQQRREYRPIADLLLGQLRLRGHDPDKLRRAMVDMLAHGRISDDDPRTERRLSAEARVAAAERMLQVQPELGHVVVWLGYTHCRAGMVVEAGDVTFFDAAWAVPNADPDEIETPHFEFPGKEELAEIIRWRLFKVARLAGEESEVETLVRVDLGVAGLAGARERALAAVDTILSLALHASNGVRPSLAQSVVLLDGVVTQTSIGGEARQEVADDHYGIGLTADAIERLAPDLGAALARADLPRFLVAAVEAQMSADVPFSREMLGRSPSEADLRSVIPLEDRVVQCIAAYAGLLPDDLFMATQTLWPHSRWFNSVDRAVRMCLLGSGPDWADVEALQRGYYAVKTPGSWAEFVKSQEAELVRLCRVESDRGWIQRMLRSVTVPTVYTAIISELVHEAEILAARRKRVRNAIVHSNPVSIQVCSRYPASRGSSASTRCRSGSTRL